MPLYRLAGSFNAQAQALGGALEGGFGFLQYFLNPNHQCAHDRLAETIAVREQRGMVGARPAE